MSRNLEDWLEVDKKKPGVDSRDEVKHTERIFRQHYRCSVMMFYMSDATLAMFKYGLVWPYTIDGT